MGESRLIKYVKILVNFIFAIGVILALFLVVPKLLGFFLPFIIGWIIAMIANPLVKFLEKKVKILRKHSSAIIIIVVIAAIVGLIYLLISVLVREVKQLAGDLPNILEYVELQLEYFSIKLVEISRDMPEFIQQFINNLIEKSDINLTEYTPKEDMFSFSVASNIAQNIAEFFLVMILTILSAYFFIARREEIVDGAKKVLPKSVVDGWYFIYNNFTNAVGGYLKAQFKIMLVLAVIMFFGFEIISVPYSFLLALGIALLDFLPVFGTGAVLWPWALIDVFTGNYYQAIGLMIIYLVCQIYNH